MGCVWSKAGDSVVSERTNERTFESDERTYESESGAQHEAIKRHVRNSLEEIEKENEILRVLEQLGDERLDEVISGCERLCEEYKGRKQIGHISDEMRTLDHEYKDKIYDFLQQELNFKFTMRDEEVRCRELGDIMFYYAFTGVEPDWKVRLIIKKILDPIDAEISLHLSALSNVLSDECTYLHFHIRLGNDPPKAFEYLIYKRPELLFSVSLSELRKRLREQLPYEKFHQLVMNTLSSQGQTCMFNLDIYDLFLFFENYRNNTDDLVELLKIRDNTGQTALHANPYFNLLILCHVITPNNQKELNELLTQKDNTNKTVHETISDSYSGKYLKWLNNQYDRGNYPLYYKPRVLILYNTHNRPGAKKEAKSIYKAFRTAPGAYRIELEKMGAKRKVIQTIKDTADNWKTSVLIVCVMSHGSVGMIEDSDGELMTLTEIEGAMCSELLKERPKILIVQCCQSRECRYESLDGRAASSNKDPGPPAMVKLNVPYEPIANHFLAVQSSVSGQTSERNVFIPYLAEQIGESSNTDSFRTLVDKVIFRMMNEKMEQKPIVKSTLASKICLKDYGELL